MTDDLANARSALERFWGQSNGGGVAWQACFKDLSALRLKQKDLERLRLRLPDATGMVGQRVATLKNMLRELDL